MTRYYIYPLIRSETWWWCHLLHFNEVQIWRWRHHHIPFLSSRIIFHILLFSFDMMMMMMSFFSPIYRSETWRWHHQDIRKGEHHISKISCRQKFYILLSALSWVIMPIEHVLQMDGHHHDFWRRYKFNRRPSVKLSFRQCVVTPIHTWSYLNPIYKEMGGKMERWLTRVF